MTKKDTQPYVFNEHLDITLCKMCEVVGADFSIVGTPDWFLKYEWTIEQENDFKLWLRDYLYNNAKARKEICQNPIKNKIHLHKVASMFCLMYGWRYKK